MDEQPKEYTGAWIPAFVMESDITPMAKLLYAEIASFTKCFASNAFFGKRLGVGERAIQKNLKILEQKKFITVTLEQGKHRDILAVRDDPERKFALPRTKVRPTPNESSYIDTNKDTQEKTHTSTLRDDDTAFDSTSLPASSSAGDGNKPVMDSAARAAHLKKVFDVLVGILQPGQKILYTEARKSKLRKRLETFKPSQLISAARNLMQDPWNTGQNPNNKKYADFDFLMRNDEKVEKWLNEKPVSKPKSVF